MVLLITRHTVDYHRLLITMILMHLYTLNKMAHILYTLYHQNLCCILLVFFSNPAVRLRTIRSLMMANSPFLIIIQIMGL